MITVTTDINNEPSWATGYMREFHNWKENIAPKNLPEGFSDWVSFFSNQSNIFFKVESVLNDSETKIIGMKYTWNNENEKLLFMIKFS